MRHRNSDPGTWRSLKLFVGLGLFFMMSFILLHLKIVVLPMVLAFFISCLLNPLVEFLQRKGIPRPLSIILALAVGIGIIWTMVSLVMLSLADFMGEMPKFRDYLNKWLSDLENFLNRYFSFMNPDMLTEKLLNIYGTAFSLLANSFVSFLKYILLTLIFTLYFLPALPSLPKRLKRAFPGRRGIRLCAGMELVSRKVQGYLLVKCMISLGLGAWFWLVCLAFGVNLAAAWGIIAFLLNFIPTVGIVVSVVLPTLVCATKFSWTVSLWLVLCLGLPAAVTLNWAEPILLGRRMDLSAVATLMAILFWGVLWGGIGMIIALPCTAVLKLTCDSFEYLNPVGKLMERGPGHGPPLPDGAPVALDLKRRLVRAVKGTSGGKERKDART
ncbi:MAG: AI-2E family transporter [Deltaproteobacteria bacterium]|nr:AI-2E family transporter [Deltaproteobacteria bacterium]